MSVEEAGAVIVHPKRPITDAGYSADFADAEGNRMGLLKTDESAVIE